MSRFRPSTGFRVGERKKKVTQQQVGRQQAAGRACARGCTRCVYYCCAPSHLPTVFGMVAGCAVFFSCMKNCYCGRVNDYVRGVLLLLVVLLGWPDRCGVAHVREGGFFRRFSSVVATADTPIFDAFVNS